MDVLARGLEQRLDRAQPVLKDRCSDAYVPADGIVPRSLVYVCQHYRREMQG
jgi:uncharacterized circularly permuted ATP-grasp superfamily protein